MVQIIYTLCALTSFSVAFLLLRGYARNKFRLLLWSGLCFLVLSLNNLLVILDRMVFPTADLLVWRLAAGLFAVLLRLYGLIWDDE